MALLKKINTNWEPSESRGLKIGDTLEVTNYEASVKSGMAILVDEAGNEIEMPGQKFNCPVCYREVEGLLNFIEHVSTHTPKRAAAPKDPEVETQTTVVISTEEAKEEVKNKRLAALEKARAARKANSEA